MASDDDYMNFLNKANEDPTAGSGAAQTTSEDAGKKALKATDSGAEIPQPLVTATKDAFYVSDADEPFVPVSLAWGKGEGLPNEGEWSRCHPLPVLTPHSKWSHTAMRGLSNTLCYTQKGWRSLLTIGTPRMLRWRSWIRPTGTGVDSTRTL